MSDSTAFTATEYARQLLRSLGRESRDVAIDNRDANDLWADSGAMWLTGPAEGEPRFCPAPLAACARGAGLALSALTDGVLPASFQTHRLLGERAAIAGLSRQGCTSAGGACQLYACADGVLALNLARTEDEELLPAWLEREATVADLPTLLPDYSLHALIERGRLLGLALAPLQPPVPIDHWFRTFRHAPAAVPTHHTPLVVDLSSLWAGPLCGSLLARCGARVIKVESEQRPDGARRGPRAFFDLMNSGKACLSLPLHTTEGRTRLRELLLQADIVIEASRPRALEQMGIVAADILSSRPGMVWLSISGYGRDEPQREWIAYGDDAGVAAGLSWLVGGAEGDPVFCGDAIADPLTGLHGALLALSQWQAGGGVLLELALTDLLAWCASRARIPVPAAEAAYTAATPQARPPMGIAGELGADNLRLQAEFWGEGCDRA